MTFETLYQYYVYHQGGSNNLSIILFNTFGIPVKNSYEKID